MQDLEHNMDELFNRASKDYPLKLGPDHWDEISAKISSNKESPREPDRKDNKKKYFGLFLLVLALILFGVLRLNRHGNQHILITEKESPVSGGRQNGTVNKTFPAGKNRVPEPAEAEILTGSNNKTIRVQGRYQSKRDKSFTTGKAASVFKSNKNTVNAIYVNSRSAVTKEKAVLKDNQRVIFNSDPDAGTTLLKPVRVDPNDDLHRSQQGNVVVTTPYSRMHPVSTLFKKTDKRKALHSLHGLYYGLVSGPGLNSVRGQRMKKIGFDLGVVGGYRFGPRLSVETGLFKAQHYYTTAGEYFSMKEIGLQMPPDMKVMDVKGSSQIVKIPVSLRYTWTGKNLHRFYTLAGFSSYIMTDESNRYNTMTNGLPEEVDGSYKKDRRYFMAAIDLAIGYDYRFGKRNSIRFEPYIQVPLKKVGIGSLPLTGTGLHIGITRTMR
ncbi:MAG: outer membrane beta-barrel protein [Chitinophagaceae bacterium]